MSYNDLDDSKRTPGRATFLNAADILERELAEDGHRIWGWVIYRCTYGSDDEFNELIARFRSSVVESLMFYNGVDLMDTFDHTIFEDESTFNNAMTSVVRDHFWLWKTLSPQLEQNWYASDYAQRYKYCLMVGQEVLGAVLEDDSPRSMGGFIKLIQRDWPLNPPLLEECNEEPIEG